MTIMAEICERLDSGLFRQHLAAGNIFDVEQVGGLEGLLCCGEQIFFTVQAIGDACIQHEAPEDVPLARSFMGQ